MRRRDRGRRSAPAWWRRRGGAGAGGASGGADGARRGCRAASTRVDLHVDGWLGRSLRTGPRPCRRTRRAPWEPAGPCSGRDPPRSWRCRSGVSDVHEPESVAVWVAVVREHVDGDGCLLRSTCASSSTARSARGWRRRRRSRRVRRQLRLRVRDRVGEPCKPRNPGGGVYVTAVPSLLVRPRTVSEARRTQTGSPSGSVSLSSTVTRTGSSDGRPSACRRGQGRVVAWRHENCSGSAPRAAVSVAHRVVEGDLAVEPVREPKLDVILSDGGRAGRNVADRRYVRAHPRQDRCRSARTSTETGASSGTREDVVASNGVVVDGTHDDRAVAVDSPARRRKPRR